MKALMTRSSRIYGIAHRNGEEYYVRSTFTRHNLDFTTDVEDMLDHGFPAVSMEPVVGDDSAKYSIKESDLPKVKEEYDRLAQLFIQREEGETFLLLPLQYGSLERPVPAEETQRMRSEEYEYLARRPEWRYLPMPPVRRP